MNNLVHLIKDWLLTDVPSFPIKDKFVLDRYLRALPYEIKKVMSMQNPKPCRIC